jgi:uncharacterized protein YhdP
MYPLAPLFGVATPSGSATLVMVAMVRIIAAIAIPQIAQYRQKADTGRPMKSFIKLHMVYLQCEFTRTQPMLQLKLGQVKPKHFTEE